VNFEDSLAEFRARFPDQGSFELRRGESIKEAVVKYRVSPGRGVYVITSCRGDSREAIYIGKAGTIQDNGSFKDQGIAKRLTMKQDKQTYRQVFFQQLIVEESLDCLRIDWFATFTETCSVPPFLAEAELLAAFFWSTGRLPRHNKMA
jgi:hypothetical protein